MQFVFAPASSELCSSPNKPHYVHYLRAHLASRRFDVCHIHLPSPVHHYCCSIVASIHYDCCCAATRISPFLLLYTAAVQQYIPAQQHYTSINMHTRTLLYSATGTAVLLCGGLTRLKGDPHRLWDHRRRHGKVHKLVHGIGHCQRRHGPDGVDVLQRILGHLCGCVPHLRHCCCCCRLSSQHSRQVVPRLCLVPSALFL